MCAADRARWIEQPAFKWIEQAAFKWIEQAAFKNNEQTQRLSSFVNITFLFAFTQIKAKESCSKVHHRVDQEKLFRFQK